MTCSAWLHKIPSTRSVSRWEGAGDFSICASWGCELLVVLFMFFSRVSYYVPVICKKNVKNTFGPTMLGRAGISFWLLWAKGSFGRRIFAQTRWVEVGEDRNVWSRVPTELTRVGSSPGVIGLLSSSKTWSLGTSLVTLWDWSLRLETKGSYIDKRRPKQGAVEETKEHLASKYETPQNSKNANLLMFSSHLRSICLGASVNDHCSIWLALWQGRHRFF